MSCDDKFSIAYLTLKGWKLEKPEEEYIKVLVKVRVKQMFMNSTWRVSVIERQTYDSKDIIESLYKKYGDEPSGELDW